MIYLSILEEKGRGRSRVRLLPAYTGLMFLARDMLMPTQREDPLQHDFIGVLAEMKLRIFQLQPHAVFG